MKRLFFFISFFIILFILNCSAFSNLPIVQKLSGPNGNVLLQEYSFSWIISTTESSITSYQYKKDYGKWTETTVPTYTWNDIPRGSHTFSVKAKDKNNQYSNPISWEFSNDITFPDMVLSSNNKIIKITDDSTSLTGIGGTYFYYDFLSKRLLSGNSFFKYEDNSFKSLGSLQLNNGYPILGHGKILKVLNGEDIAYVYDYEGNFIKQINMVENPSSNNQSIYGFFLDENNFVISTDGNKNIAQFNILTEDKLKIAYPDEGWFGAIYKNEPYYYVYNASGKIYRIDTSNLNNIELVITGLPTHVTGMVVIDHRIYFSSNFGYGFYIYDMSTKELLKYYYFNKPKGLFLLD